MPENRIQQLIDAGVTDSPSSFTQGARQVINSLTDDEFNCLLAIRSKIYAQDNGAGEQFDKHVVFAF